MWQRDTYLFPAVFPQTYEEPPSVAELAQKTAGHVAAGTAVELLESVPSILAGPLAQTCMGPPLLGQ